MKRDLLVIRRRMALEIAEAIFHLYGLSQTCYDLDAAASVIEEQLPLTYAEAEQAMERLCKDKEECS